MSVRASQAFAANRKAVISELLNKLNLEFVPSYNAEIEDIRRQFEKMVTFADEQPISAQALKEAAESRRKARILDINKRKNEFIQSLQVHMKMELAEKIKEYGGTEFEDEESIEGAEEGKTRKVNKVKFPDGSMAKVPRNLFIDYQAFAKV